MFGFGTFLSDSKVGCFLGSLKLFSAVLKAFQFPLLFHVICFLEATDNLPK